MIYAFAERLFEIMINTGSNSGPHGAQGLTRTESFATPGNLLIVSSIPSIANSFAVSHRPLSFRK